MMLKALRLNSGLTVRALAKKAGMSYPYVSNVENGKADPSLSTLKRLAKALGVSVGDLVKEPTPQRRR
jgi:transcriptional regulator with XRE-family HTH domain